jgi:hypothetical protein
VRLCSDGRRPGAGNKLRGEETGAGNKLRGEEPGAGKEPCCHCAADRLVIQFVLNQFHFESYQLSGSVSLGLGSASMSLKS